ncbi:MAG: hypothetical protein MK364_23020 [Pirellulales bacterium]|nr:hypothetical protein [Pirellulales bacterium]
MKQKTIDVVWQRRARRIPPRHWAVEQYAEHWRRDGWKVRHQFGIPRIWHRLAELTLLHVDLSVVPPTYRDWALSAAQRGLVWNARIDDIRKSQVSSNLLLPDGDWTGRVIVKTDRNFAARPEAAQRFSVHKKVWRDAGYPAKKEYLVKDSLADVPAWVWRSSHWVVERYFEHHEGGASLWTLTIIGTEMELVRFSTDSTDTNNRRRYTAYEVHEVDNALRTMVSQLGIEYGRLDLFRIADRWELIDVNKTPGSYPRQDAEPERQAFYDRRIADLARGCLHQIK